MVFKAFIVSLGSILCGYVAQWSVWNLCGNLSINSVLKIFDMSIRTRSRIHRSGWAQEFIHSCMGLLPEVLILHYLPDISWLYRNPLFSPLSRNCYFSHYAVMLEGWGKGEVEIIGIYPASWNCSSTGLKRRFLSHRMLSSMVFLYCHAPGTGLPENWSSRE